MTTKSFLAAGAVLLALAVPAAAQVSGDTSGNPNVSGRPDLWLNGQNPAAGYADPGIDYGTTQSVAPALNDQANIRRGRDNSSPADEDSSENGDRVVGGRAH